MNTVIGVAGDWHGDTGWAFKSIRAFADAGITRIHQLGDFGIWPGKSGASFIRKVEQCLKINGITLDVTLGNHEDYTRVNAVVPDEDGIRWYQPHIRLLPRGWRSEETDKKIVSLGGAASIDFENRIEHISWWRDEAITLGDIYRTVQDGTADVMFAHEAPTGVKIYDEDTSWRWSAAGLRYAKESSDAMRQAVDSVKPKLFFHGHYHHYYDKEVTLFDGIEEYTTRFIGLDMNGSKTVANVILDYQTLEVTPLILK